MGEAGGEALFSEFAEIPGQGIPEASLAQQIQLSSAQARVVQ
jgi:hypothetical protein